MCRVSFKKWTHLRQHIKKNLVMVMDIQQREDPDLAKDDDELEIRKEEADEQQDGVDKQE